MEETKEQVEFLAAVQDFMDRNKFEILCESQESTDPFFSWRPCEICGQLPGDRYEFSGWVRETNTVVDGIAGCPDCLCYLANGDLPERYET